MTRSEHQAITKKLIELMKAPKDLEQLDKLIALQREVDLSYMNSESTEKAVWELDLASRAVRAKG